MEAIGLGDETFERVAARLRDGARRHNEFPQNYRYDGEPSKAATREDALAVLQRLALGVDAERLLERIAGREDAPALRSLLLEIGAQTVTGRRGPNLQPEATPAASGFPPPL